MKIDTGIIKSPHAMVKTPTTNPPSGTQTNGEKGYPGRTGSSNAVTEVTYDHIKPSGGKSGLKDKSDALK